MNSFLKAIIKEAFDAEAIVVDIVAKSWAKLLQDSVAAGMDAIALAGVVAQAKSDCEALLANPAADADLLAYVVSLSGGLGDAYAMGIITAAADLALKNVVGVEALVAAIKNKPAPAPAAA
ncbi:MAG: hypothetical protein ACXWPM_00100 [Bdellovibrionota bacterium]